MNTLNLHRRRLVAGLIASVGLSAGVHILSSTPARSASRRNAPSGRIIVESTQGLKVFDVTARTQRTFAVLPSDIQTGVTASVAGLIADQNNYRGVNARWRVSLRSAADGQVVRDYEVPHASSLPIGVAAISADGARLAIALSEPARPDGGGFLDRVLVVELASGKTTMIDAAAEAVWLGNGELLVRNKNRIRVLSASLESLGELPFTANSRDASMSGSPDGRLIVYESNGQIRGYDRDEHKGWVAARSTRTLYAPVISPDGAWLAVLRGARSSGLFVHVVPFAAGSTAPVSDADSLFSRDGKALPGDERFAWIPE